MTGADQHGYAGRRTNKIEVAGAEQKAKTRLYWWDIGAKRKKRGVFSYGEVFFLLTCPLMGDPGAFAVLFCRALDFG